MEKSGPLGRKRCGFGSGCMVQPSFNFPGEVGGMCVPLRFAQSACCNTVRRYCCQHQLEGMVNVVNKRCEVKGCTKRPSVNYPGVRPASRCGDHKLPGMTQMFRRMSSADCSDDIKAKIQDVKMREQKRGAIMKLQRGQIIAEKMEDVMSAMINDHPPKKDDLPMLPPASAFQDMQAKLGTAAPSTPSFVRPQLDFKPYAANSTSSASLRAAASGIMPRFEPSLQLPSSPFLPTLSPFMQTSPSLLQTSPFSPAFSPGAGSQSLSLEASLLRVQMAENVLAATLSQNMMLAQAIANSQAGFWDTCTWPAAAASTSQWRGISDSDARHPLSHTP